MRLKYILILFSFVILSLGFLNLVSASFNISNFSLQKDYSPSEDISGWVNISFENQLINSTISDNLGNSITLEELLNLNSNYISVLSSDNLTINSSFQKIYFDNASFSLPSSEISLFVYNLSIDDEVFLSENISISNVQEIIAEELQKKNSELQNLTTEINTYSLFLRTQIKNAIDLEGIEYNLTTLEELYNSSEPDFDVIFNELKKIKIPEDILESESANKISFIPDADDIDLDVLQTIGGGSYDSNFETEYKNAILFWAQENLEPKITFKKISAQYENSEKNLLSYIQLNFDSVSSETYFIIEDLNNIEFQKNYGEEKEENYIYIDLSQIDNEVVFTTTENLGVDNLPMFVSPSLNEISLGGVDEPIIDSEKESSVSKWVLFSLIVILLLIIFGIVYFILKSWYDRKYENYLFKNKNNLYNLVIYINTAKKKGMNNSEIEKNLRKAKWNSEQIRYVMRKYAGKRTGLWSPKFAKTNNEIQYTKFNKPKR